MKRKVHGQSEVPNLLFRQISVRLTVNQKLIDTKSLHQNETKGTWTK